MTPFPDLKGQAPLRLGHSLFEGLGVVALFLTSKVRLHCDLLSRKTLDPDALPFPDLKGQAPLRRYTPPPASSASVAPFPDLKGQAPLRPGTSRSPAPG